MAELKDLMTIKETAAYLRMSERQLFRYMNAGKIKFGRIGKSVRFRSKDVLAALDRIFDDQSKPEDDAAMG